MEHASALLDQVPGPAENLGAPGFWRDFLLGMLKPAAATAVVAMAVALSFSQRLQLEREMLYATGRVFLQLSVVGFVLHFIFAQKNALWILLAYLFMVTIAGYVAGQRAKHVSQGKHIAWVSILVGTAITMLVLVVLRVFPFTPKYIVPMAGMVVGNAMATTGITMKKLREDVQTQRNMVGGDCACFGRDATAGDASAGEEFAGDRSVPRRRQRQDGRPHHSPWLHDGAHLGRRVASGGHPDSDRGDEYHHGRLHRQQHRLLLPLLARLLHQVIPA